MKLGYSRLKRNIYLYELSSNNETEDFVINSSLQNFIKYIQSEEAQKIVSQLKLIPLTIAEISLNEDLEQIKIGGTGGPGEQQAARADDGAEPGIAGRN